MKINKTVYQLIIFIGIIHRDVKMQNILVTTNPSNKTDNYFIKLTDFGLSIVKQGFGSTFLNEVCGTVLYMGKKYSKIFN